MTNNDGKIFKIYDKVILSRPALTVTFILILFAVFSYWIKDFKLDASSDSIVLEHDEDMRYYRKVAANFDSQEFLIMTFRTEEADVFSDKVLNTLKKLRADLTALERVDSVVTLLDVPLLRSPQIALKDIQQKTRTLESSDVDMSLARIEFKESPIYREMLVSSDMQSTAILINFRNDKKLTELGNSRTLLREKKYAKTLTAEDAVQLETVEKEYKAYQAHIRTLRHQDIISVRRIMDNYRNDARLFLGGVPMVTDDMITYVENDLKVFGIGMILFLVLSLGIIFRTIRWVVLPLACCITSVVVMIGGLGFFGWDVTVISSNFVSIQLIMTMEFSMYLIVRYRELILKNPETSNHDLIKETVKQVFMPCFFSCTTTIAGFSSLIVCDILPVINFGWMMTLGLTVSMIVTFLLFPPALLLIRKPKPVGESQFGLAVTNKLANFTQKRGVVIYSIVFLLICIIIYGASQLKVENSFINYFKKSTEIYQGMKVIDRELGGTTILDVILNFDETSSAKQPSANNTSDSAGDKNEFDEFSEFEEEQPKDNTKYWFTMDKLRKIEQVHDYMDGLEGTGKVLSLATLLKTARQLTGNQSLDNFELALLFNELPDKFKKILITPYVSVKDNQARIFVRMIDSMETLHRDEFIKKVNRELGEKLGFKQSSYRLTNLMVLYNNMLQSLFSSQISTIGITLLLLFGMFLVLFRSFKISIIAMIPNVISSFLVLGILGIFKIPLDLMTITIASISSGIAVDNTIQYLYQFRRLFPTTNNDYWQTMHLCHSSIGNAIYYAAITIIIGFSILAFSNFIPTILFGLLTGLALTSAVLGALILLPRLIILFKPFGPGK